MNDPRNQFNDCHGQPLAVTDRVRNIESNWFGQVMASEVIDGHPMLVCLGVNFWDGELDQDDKQQHAPADVVLAARLPSSDDPINQLNFM